MSLPASAAAIEISACQCGGVGDVDDVNILAGDDFAEIPVALDILVAGFSDRGDGVIQVFLIDVTNGEQLASLVELRDVAHAHAAGANDGPGEHIAGGGITRPAEHMARHNGESGR